MSNPGSELSKAVEAEAIRFREVQDEIQKLRIDQQTLLSQQSENEMVKQELNLLSEDDQVYKLIGPALMKNDTEDARQTVEQRLTMITGELKKVEKTIKEKEEKAQDIAKKVQEIQSMMQSMAAEAARLAASQAVQS